MKTNEFDDLIRTVEQIRLKLHPELDAAFLRAVIQAEEQNPEDDAEALRAIEAALGVVLDADGED
jgi:predicted transposase YbfD/YdcC